MLKSRFRVVKIFALLGFLSLSLPALADPPPNAYADLKNQLVRKGLDKNYVNQVFNEIGRAHV